MHKKRLTKPDGRGLILYAREPIPSDVEAPAPGNGRPPAPHLRWHPLRGEWIAYATHRQQRTFLPPAQYDPLAPSRDPARPTEVPRTGWDVAVFDNRFPTFATAGGATVGTIVETRPADGAAEVVVFTPSADGGLGSLPLWHVELLVEVWSDRYRELGARPEIEYVMPFENRGVEVGVTLPHPHGQIYAYPFVPPIAARELEEQRRHFERHGRGLLAELIAAEVEDGRRIVHLDDDAVAFVPVCARWAYELWVAPRRPAPSLAALDAEARRAFAIALKAALERLDALWSAPMPYVLVLHQAPTDGHPHPEAHVHAEIYPAYRMPGRLKYLAGSELGAGVFTADTVPEETAAALRNAPAVVEPRA
jgi:UDPglucose--hexose-1-phosphate uridylyltransferase